MDIEEKFLKEFKFKRISSACGTSTINLPSTFNLFFKILIVFTAPIFLADSSISSRYPIIFSLYGIVTLKPLILFFDY